jgi:hypothetical protein
MLNPELVKEIFNVKQTSSNNYSLAILSTACFCRTAVSSTLKDNDRCANKFETISSILEVMVLVQGMDKITSGS